MTRPTPSDLFDDPRDRALCEAAAAGEVERVRPLVADGANVNAEGRDGATPLLWALAASSEPGVRALLNAGANPNHVVQDGFSALSMAASHEDPRFLRLLLQNGGDPSLTSGVGEPLLHTAITSERWANVGILLDAGADINSRNTMGVTPVLLCAYLGDYEQVLALLRRGADYTLPADNGSTLANETQASRLDPESASGEWLQRVQSVLRDRGVRFPAATPMEVRRQRGGQ